MDIGAHVGYYAIHAAKVVGPTGHVFAFEPVPSNLRRLEENAALNGFSNLTSVASAVGNRTGKATFRAVDVPGESGWGSLLLDPASNTKDLEVSVVSLDDFAEQHGVTRVDVLKLDVQGGEFDVLTGAGKILDAWHPTIVCEVTDVYWGSAQTTTAKDLFEYLAGREYEPWVIGTRGRLTRLDDAGSAPQNLLFRFRRD
ncbi:MAG: FkbM family methyltransferase [Actinomycetota bacterium]